MTKPRKKVDKKLSENSFFVEWIKWKTNDQRPNWKMSCDDRKRSKPCTGSCLHRWQVDTLWSAKRKIRSEQKTQLCSKHSEASTTGALILQKKRQRKNENGFGDNAFLHGWKMKLQKYLFASTPTTLRHCIRLWTADILETGKSLDVSSHFYEFHYFRFFRFSLRFLRLRWHKWENLCRFAMHEKSACDWR